MQIRIGTRKGRGLRGPLKKGEKKRSHSIRDPGRRSISNGVKGVKQKKPKTEKKTQERE